MGVVPISASRRRYATFHFATSTMYAGMCTGCAALINARFMPCLIHHEAYVLKQAASAGSKPSTTHIRPMLPSSIRSESGRPRLESIFGNGDDKAQVERFMRSRASGQPVVDDLPARVPALPPA